MNYLTVKELTPAVLNTAQAAKYIGISKSELDRARISGELCGEAPPKFFRVGKKAVRYRVEDLDSWLNSQKRYESLAQQYSDNA